MIVFLTSWFRYFDISLSLFWRFIINIFRINIFSISRFRVIMIVISCCLARWYRLSYSVFTASFFVFPIRAFTLTLYHRGFVTSPLWLPHHWGVVITCINLKSCFLFKVIVASPSSVKCKTVMVQNMNPR